MNSQYHCECCQYNQNRRFVNLSKNYQDNFFTRDKRVCEKCGIKQDKVFMNEFSDDTTVCKYGCVR